QRTIDLDVLGTRVDGNELNVVGRAAAGVDLDDTLLLEDPLHRARLAELAAVPCERRPDLGRRAVPVVGGRFDHDRHAAWPVALVQDTLDLGTLAATRRTLDRPVDVRVRHVHCARTIDRETEPEVPLRVSPTLTRGEHDLPRHLGENDAPLDVGRAFLALDRGPL